MAQSSPPRKGHCRESGREELRGRPDCAIRGEWDEADEAYSRALRLFESQGNKQMIAQVLENQSEVSFGRDRLHEGIANCDLALAMFAEVGDEVGRGNGLRSKTMGVSS